MAKRDWFQIIDKAIEDGSFTEADEEAAGNWPDCACGVQSRFIPRYKKTQWKDEEETRLSVKGEPVDQELSDLGVDFSDAVSENEPYRAGYILAKIERRSGELLAKQARAAARKGKR